MIEMQTDADKDMAMIGREISVYEKHCLRRRRGTVELARDAVVNRLQNGAYCHNDTDGDGDCGRPMCPICNLNGVEGKGGRYDGR